MSSAVQQPVHVLPRKRSVATVMFTDLSGRVLVVKPTYKPGWELPGGAVEDHESPGAAAVREVGEELGIRCAAGALLALDYVPASEVRTEGLVAVFDGGTLVDVSGFRLPADELSDAVFVAVGELGEYLPPLLARRAVAAVGARDTGCAVYLEDGRPCRAPADPPQ